MERKRMLNNSSRRRRHVWAGKIEYQVAAIMLDFPHLFFKPTPGIASLLSTATWASKKKRSAINVADADDFVVVNDDRHTAAPPPPTLSLAHCEHRSLLKPRRKSGFTKIKEKFLKNKVEELTKCQKSLKTEIVKVHAYHEKLSNVNSLLKALKEEENLKKFLAEARKKKEVATNPENGERETNAATVFPCQQPMSLMRQAAQSSSSFAYAGPSTSSNGIPLSSAMDPPAAGLVHLN